MRALAAAALLTLAGCEEKIADPPPGAILDDDAPKFVREPGPKPFLVTYRPAADGGPEVYRAALLGGVLDLTGPCVRLQDASGAMRVIVTTSGAALKRDSLGWFLPSGNDRLRHGASVRAGGGEISGLPGAAMLAGEVPAACRRGPAIELVGIHRAPPPGGLQGSFEEPPPPPR